MQLPVLQPSAPQPRSTSGSGELPSASHPRTPQDVLRWTLERFAGWNVVMTTGFGMEGCAVIDMLDRLGASLDVVYLDTHFLFPQTLALRDRLRARYAGFRFIDRGTALTPQRQAELYGERLWEHNPDLCCQLRKVDPMREALREVDVWITGVRREQSPQRSNAEQVQWDWRYELIKVNPLTFWTRQQVWDYVRTRGIPHNPLHERGYPSIGCTHCTHPVAEAGPGDYSRAGRWPGQGKTECGLHDGCGDRSDPPIGTKRQEADHDSAA